jgi:hypothetical protein
MSLDLPPFLLIFDLPVLLAGKAREWQDFSRLGQCYVPQVIYDALQKVAKTGEPEPEKVAREFNRFFGESDWQLTADAAEHPALQPLPGQQASQKARLTLALAQCVYGTARHNPGRMVILVSNDQPNLQRILGLGQNNLTGIPLAALLLWTRSGRRPDVVNAKLQGIRSAPALCDGLTIAKPPSKARSGPAPSPGAKSAASSQSHNLRSADAGGWAAPPRPKKRPPWLWLPIGLIGLALAAAAWTWLHPRPQPKANPAPSPKAVKK